MGASAPTEFVLMLPEMRIVLSFFALAFAIDGGRQIVLNGPSVISLLIILIGMSCFSLMVR